MSQSLVFLGTVFLKHRFGPSNSTPSLFDLSITLLTTFQLFSSRFKALMTISKPAEILLRHRRAPQHKMQSMTVYKRPSVTPQLKKNFSKLSRSKKWTILTPESLLQRSNLSPRCTERPKSILRRQPFRWSNPRPQWLKSRANLKAHGLLLTMT